MNRILRGLWDRARGKWHVQIICNKVFKEWADREKNLLPLDNLHVAVLLVYNSANKQLLSPHKEPPSTAAVRAKIQGYHAKNIYAINHDEFCLLIMAWIQKDLHFVLANKIMLALLAAPALAVITKKAARRVPQIGNVVDKVPNPLLIPIYSAGLVLLQDIRVD